MAKISGIAALFTRTCTYTCICAAANSHAEPYTPDPTTVVAEWDHNQISQFAASRQGAAGASDPQWAVQIANAYLGEAGQPGQARLYGLAEDALEPWVREESASPELLVAWARIQQHEHEFDRALAALDRVFSEEPQHISANLLAARINLVQNHPETAEKHCLRLLGHADLLTISACSMEATSYQGKLQESYDQLSRLVERQGLPDGPRAPWLSQMLADMATRLGKPQDALRWLKQPLETADVSYLAQWADVQLAVDEPKKVLDQLGPLVASAPAMDDALLLRLTQAEKQLGEAGQWQQHLSERVALREQRQDTQHASDLARYYLDIDPQPQKALHWARLNWQSAKEPSDKTLLQKAVAFAEHTKTPDTNEQGR
jgi:tetratricopeptide (TPR) repeat protein